MEENKSIDTLLQRRRLMSFDRQKSMRDTLINASRLSFMAESEPSQTFETIQTIQGQNLEIEPCLQEPVTKTNFKHKHMKSKTKQKSVTNYSSLARKLQIPEHMITVPTDLSEFLMFVRPAGKKVLVVLKGTDVVVVGKLGLLYTAFTSKYLYSNERTILEGILSEQNTSRIYITDMIQWKGEYKAGQQAIFRYYWLNSNLPKSFKNNTKNQEEFVLLDIYKATRSNFSLVYDHLVSYKKDGIVFVHQKSMYQHTINPGVLYWKDNQVSEYCQVKTPLTAVATLVSGSLYTVEGQKLIEISPLQQQQLKPYKQARFSYTKVGLLHSQSQEQMVVQFQGFQIMECYPWVKYASDSLSKILHQYRSLTTPILASQIYASLP